MGEPTLVCGLRPLSLCECIPTFLAICSYNAAPHVLAFRSAFPLPLQVDYENIKAAIVEQCKEANLQPLESFITKIIQVGVI